MLWSAVFMLDYRAEQCRTVVLGFGHNSVTSAAAEPPHVPLPGHLSALLCTACPAAGVLSCMACCRLNSRSNFLHACLRNGCAGVIWRGDSVIDGVPETLDMLRAMVRCGRNL